MHETHETHYTRPRSDRSTRVQVMATPAQTNGGDHVTCMHIVGMHTSTHPATIPMPTKIMPETSAQTAQQLKIDNDWRPNLNSETRKAGEIASNQLGMSSA